MKKILLTFVFCLICLFGLSGCGEIVVEKSNYKINITSLEDVEINSFVSYDKTMIILQVNNNSDNDIMNLNVECQYHLSTEEANANLLYIKSHSQYYYAFTLPSDDKGVYFIPEVVDIIATVDREYQNKYETVMKDRLLNDSVSSNFNINDTKLDLAFTNNSDKSISKLSVIAVFKKNGNPIAIRQLIAANIDKEYKDSVDIPVDYGEEFKFDYDSIEIVINNAITLDEDKKQENQTDNEQNNDEDENSNEGSQVVPSEGF